jgi:hypothetical protein
MGQVKKEEWLFTLEARVEQHLQEAIRIYQNLDDWVLLQPSASGGWSIAQCLEHLNSYGHYYLPHLHRSLEKQKGNLSEGFKSTWLGNYFTKLMEPASGKRKFKAFKDHEPSTNLEAHTVVAEFIRQQEVLLQYLQKARNANLNTAGIPISIFKWVKLKPGDVFQFLIAHNERHMQQARRNLK